MLGNRFRKGSTSSTEGTVLNIVLAAADFKGWLFNLVKAVTGTDVFFMRDLDGYWKVYARWLPAQHLRVPLLRCMPENLFAPPSHLLPGPPEILFPPATTVK
ncbi:hypothetical protein TSUD_00090 [Trifolium subterraneum]|nr:hypothetical protein TSUD_00090 [Trifolium subterraneum]